MVAGIVSFKQSICIIGLGLFLMPLAPHLLGWLKFTMGHRTKVQVEVQKTHNQGLLTVNEVLDSAVKMPRGRLAVNVKPVVALFESPDSLFQHESQTHSIVKLSSAMMNDGPIEEAMAKIYEEAMAKIHELVAELEKRPLEEHQIIEILTASFGKDIAPVLFGAMDVNMDGMVTNEDYHFVTHLCDKLEVLFESPSSDGQITGAELWLFLKEKLVVEGWSDYVPYVDSTLLKTFLNEVGDEISLAQRGKLAIKKISGDQAILFVCEVLLKKHEADKKAALERENAVEETRNKVKEEIAKRRRELEQAHSALRMHDTALV